YRGFGGLIKIFGWQGAVVVCGITTALLTLLWSSRSCDWPAQHPSVNESEKAFIGTSPLTSGVEGGWSELLQNPSLLLVTLSYACVGYFQYLFVYWMAYYFEKVLNLGADASK